MRIPGYRTMAATALATVVLAACGTGSDTPEDAGAAEDTQDEAADGTDVTDGALLGIIDPGVDVADEPADPAAAEFRTGEDGEGLVIGDWVRTDTSGFAQVDWFDGALARVDADSLYALTEFDAAPGQAVVVTELDTGRIWNRLRAEEVDTYEVVTDVGTAAVRGTAFWVQCVAEGACTFAVLEGEVVVTTTDGTEVVLGPGDQVTVAEGGVPSEVTPTDPADDWAVRNIELDAEDGFAPIDLEPAQASAALADDCPLRAVPDGFTRAEFPDQAEEAAEFCYFEADGAGPGEPASIRWARSYDEATFGTELIEANRTQFEQNLADKHASTCSQGADGVFTAFDEALGDGRLAGFSWQTVRGAFDSNPGGGECAGQVGLWYYGVAVDGEVFAVVLAPDGDRTHSSTCPVPPDGVVQDPDLPAYNDCLFAAKEAQDQVYRELAAVLLGA